jgi:hypothetical protein
MKTSPILLLFVALGVTTHQLAAQGVTTAGIYGIVVDSKDGKGLPAATVVAIHTPSGTVLGTSTREDGRFNLQGLRVGGPYSIKVTLVGYKYSVQEGTYLELGQNLKMDFSLTEEAIQFGEVTAIGEQNSVLSASRTGAANNVTQQQIERLPTVARNFVDFQRLTPQFAAVPQGSGATPRSSAAGRPSRFNNIQVDGAVINDLFGLASSNGTPGGNAGTAPISLDAIQEFQVVISPFDVRQSGFTGGGINAITRSGSNTFEGSIFAFGRNQELVGKSPDTARTRFAKFDEWQGGLRFGGPIMEDKAFFFINGEITRRNAPVDVLLARAGLSGSNVSPIPADSAARFASILKNQYGYDPGSYDIITDKTRSYKVFTRLDFNIADRHRATMRINYVDATDDVPTRTLNRFYLENSTYVFGSATTSAVAQLTSTFGSKFSNELTLGFTEIRDKRNTLGANFPFVRVRLTGSQFVGLDLNAGTENFSGANRLDTDIFEITNNFTYYSGDHVFTFGTHNEIFKFENLFIRDFFGNYEFNSLADLQAGQPARYQYSYSQTSNPLQTATFKAITFGFYGQVESQVSPTVKLTAGMRVDIPTLPDDPAYNRKVDSTFGALGLGTNKVPNVTVLYSPRIGVNWDVTGERTTQIRGGVGVFSGRIPYVWISNQYGNTGVEFARVDVSNRPAGFFSSNPNNQPRPGVTPGLTAVTTSEINLTDKNFQMPQLVRVNMAADQKLPWGLVGTIEGIYSKTLNDVVYQDINIRPTGTVLAGDGRPLFGTYSGTSRNATVNRINTAFTNVILLKNSSRGFQWNLTAQIKRDLKDGLFATAAYSLGRSKDQNSVLSDQAVSQWRFNPTTGDPNDPPLAYSSFDIRHRILLSGSYRYEWSPDLTTTISVFYNGQSGRPFSYVYDGDVNADGQTENDLVYVPSNQSDIILVRVSGSTISPAPQSDYDALFAYIGRDEYLSKYRGQIVPRNGGREPWFGQVDVRLAQEIPTVSGHKLEITVDILNILNLISNTMGRQRFVNLQRDLLLRFEGLDATTRKPMFSFRDKSDPFQYDQLFSRWQAQLGLRYTF